MSRTTSTTSTTTLSAVALMLAAGSGVAHADKYGFYANENNQQWGLTNMPDLDQVRAPIFQLPGLLNDGRMFCVPTSTMNAFAYIARHGYPNIDPGIEAWDNGSQSNYITATNELADLGALMGTGGDDGLGGTSAQGWYDGTRAWLPSDQFDVYQRLALENNDTTTREIARIGRLGGLVMACYGRWEHDGNTLTERTGGHCVTATRVDIDFAVHSEFRYRNPSTGSNESMFHQDDFRFSIIDCFDNNYTFEGNNYAMSRMDFNISDPDDDRLRLIDFLGVIYPKEGLTNWPAGSISKLAPNPIDPSEPGITSFAAPAPVICCEMSPGRTEWLLLTEPTTPGGPNKIFNMNPNDGSTTEVASPSDPRGMTFCRRGYLNVIDGRELIQYDLRRRSPEVGRTTIPTAFDPTAIAYDDDADEIVILTDTTILRYGFDLSGPDIITLPPAAQTREHILLARQVGVPAIVVADDTSLIALVPDENGDLEVAGRETLPSGSTVDSISEGNEGRIFVVGQNLQLNWTVVNQGSAGTAEIEFVEVAGDAPFDGFPIGTYFSASTDRTNYDARKHGTPGWNTNILTDDLVAAPERPDCPSDFNNDDVSDVLDLLAFLVEWFAENETADFNNDGTTNVLDLLDFLSVWFPGCSID